MSTGETVRLHWNYNLGELYRQACYALRCPISAVHVVYQEPNGSIWRLTTHQYNQKYAPMKCKIYDPVLFSLGEFENGVLSRGGVLVKINNTMRIETRFYSPQYGVELKRDGKFLKAFLTTQTQCDVTERIIHRWAKKVLEVCNRQIERCLAVKEDLMAAAWHPDRVVRWLEAGVDMEDM